jgi:subtilisin family serine protease
MCSLSARATESPAVLLPASTESSSALLDLVRLKELIERTRGSADVKIGLIDGPVAVNHPDLPSSNIREIPGNLPASCARTGGSASTHEKLVAGILEAKRGSGAPATAPHCTLLVRPIFGDGPARNNGIPSATPDELATAIKNSTS